MKYLFSIALIVSMSGFPKLKPWVVRRWIGPMVLQNSIRQGFMKHGLTADIPGAEALVESGGAAAGIEALKGSIERFNAFQNTLAPHFAYGDLEKSVYSQAHALHILDHFVL